MIKNFVKGLLFGAAAGTVGGLLLAPRSGKDTRRKIRDEIDETTELTLEVNDSLNHFKDALEDLVVTAKDLIPPFQDGIKKDVEAFKFQAEPRIQQINEHVEKMQSHLNGKFEKPANPERFSLNRFSQENK